MRRWIVLAVLVCAMTGVAAAQEKYRLGQPPVPENSADFTIPVHIAAVHLRPACNGNSSGCVDGAYADAEVDGKKVEFFGPANDRQTPQLAPGDYRAKLAKKPLGGGQAVLGQPYVILLSDRSGWECQITGLEE